jgi:hypothetical protein
MSLSRFAKKAFLCGLLALGPSISLVAQGIYSASGVEYAIAGTLPGEQVHPCLTLTTNGGFLVWEDNITDGYGLGVSALRLDSSFSASLAPFRVNVTALYDQERPQVSLLKSGGAAFVWQSGKEGFQHIYARFLSNTNTWLSTNDIPINAATNCYQMNASIATLTNGNVVIVYSSLNQYASNSLQDVYAQILSPAGQKIGGEFLVNQFTSFNQRSAKVAALAGGGFVVVWVSEQERSGNMDNPSAAYLYSPTNRATVDIFARLYNGNGAAVAGEFLVNTNLDPCSDPAVAAGTDGGFMIVWAQKNMTIPQFSWDIFARPFSSAGVGGTAVVANGYQYGDQYLPRVSALGTDYLVVWTSLAQDGSREGVYGRILRNNGTPAAAEMRINTTTMSQQIHPVVSSDGFSRYVAVWSSFVGGLGSFDLYAQRYVNTSQPLLPMNPPFVYVPFVVVSNVYQPQIQVSWPFQSGLPIDHYEVYVDGSPNPAVSLTNNTWTLTGIAPNSTHSFQVAYVTFDTRRSPLSGATTATTWMGTIYGGALPVEWVASYYGYGNPWPGVNVPLVPGGPTLLQVFLSGGNPLDPSTWLRTQIVSSPQGYFLTWNPRPGFTYQIQTSSDLSTWGNYGLPRFAAGHSDSCYVGGHTAAYYRVLLMR